MRSFSRILLAGALGVLSTSWAIAQSPTEAELKAALLFNFAKFVEWPDPPSTAITFGVLGDPEVLSSLRGSFEGKAIGTRVAGFRKISTLEEITDGIQVLFIGKAESPRIAEIVKRSKVAPILLVSDWPSFAASGGMIEILTEKSRLQFDINQSAVAENKLTASSKLLHLARHVITK